MNNQTESGNKNTPFISLTHVFTNSKETKTTPRISYKVGQKNNTTQNTPYSNFGASREENKFICSAEAKPKMSCASKTMERHNNISPNASPVGTIDYRQG